MDVGVILCCGHLFFYRLVSVHEDVCCVYSRKNIFMCFPPALECDETWHPHVVFAVTVALLVDAIVGAGLKVLARLR